jgi:autotransporter-associated beta strand protein
MMSRNGKAEASRRTQVHQCFQIFNGDSIDADFYVEMHTMTILQRWIKRTFDVKRKACASRRPSFRGICELEGLESRVMPSGFVMPLSDFSTGSQAHTNLVAVAANGSEEPDASPSPSGVVPSAMEAAYGANEVMFGSVVGNGAGQTIAIVDAFSQPNIVSDLAAFDSYYGLAAPPSFTVLNETGGTTLPAPDVVGGWGVETSLDVEWAHVIAPGANIALFEASSAGGDLDTAVNTARNYPGVSAVSMSWGGGENSGDPSNDSQFTTPSGHTGVTFLAATGDGGAYINGVAASYPPVSPNVVAVGGTTLHLSNGTSGTYVSESGWSGSGGGLSQFESEPSFQSGVVPSSITTTQRAVPDVSMDADPGSGVAVYDTYDFGSSTPWATFGGTSLATPMFAGVIAIANQGYALYHSGATLNGAGQTQTLPELYSLAANPTSYVNDFHDVATGNNGYAAEAGYDLVTGIGSPAVNELADDLAGVAPTYGYADTRWAGLFNGTVVTNANPVTGNQSATIGLNAFASVNAAIAGAASGGYQTVIVNGDDLSGLYGAFNEAVNVNAAVGLVIQYGPVTFNSLTDSAVETSIGLGGVNLTVGANNTSTTVDAAISGTGSLTKVGSGALTLNGAGGYSGATTVSGGSLIAGTTNAFSSASAFIVGGGAALTLNGFNETVGSLAGSGTVQDASSTSAVLTDGSANTSTTFSGVLQNGPGSGVLSFVKTGSGALTLSTANTYSGATSIQQGSVIATANAALGSTAAGATVTTGATLGFSGNVNYSSAKPINLGQVTGAYIGFTGGTGGATSIQKILNWTYTSGSTSLNYSSGFATNPFQLNGGAVISGTALELTDGNGSEARSAFIPTTVSVAGFTSTFQFTYGANPAADGLTFAIQNTGPTAVGGTGGQLGYGGIGNSLALEINLYNNVSQLGVDTNGAISHTTDLTTSGINFHSNPTDTYKATVTYDGSSTITVTITDTNSSATTGALTFSNAVPFTVGSSGTIQNVSGTNSFAGPINFGANGTVQSSAGALTLSGNFALNTFGLTVAGAGNTNMGGVVSGSGATGITETGSGVLTLTHTNTYTGATAIQRGSVIAAANGSLGSGASAVTVGSGATLGFSSNINYTTAQSVNLGQGPIAYVGFTGGTGGATSIQKILNWTYTSGSTSLNYSGGFANNPFQLNGGATISGTALELTDGNNSEARSAFIPTMVGVAGFTSTFEFTYGANPAADGLTFVIQNTGPTAVGGPGNQLGYGGIGNSLAVELNLYNNVSQLGVDTNGAIGHTIDLSGSGINFHNNPADTYQATVTYNGSSTITVTITDTNNGNTTGALTFSDSVPSTPGGSGTIENVSGTNSFAGPINLGANGTVQSVAGALTLSGNVALNGSGLTVTGAGNTNLSGVVSGSGTNGLTKTGTGILTMSSNNTYTGTTSVGAGVLHVNGSLSSSSAVTVASGATLGGNHGTVGQVTVNGNLTPGGPAQLTTGQLNFGATGSYNVALDGTVPGTGYDQVIVTSSSGVNLSSSPALNVTLGYTPAPGDALTIIKNQGGGSVTGTFNNLAEGSLVTVGSQSFTISYVGGASGHDIVLTTATAPAITTQPMNQTINAGGTTTFTATASGNPTPTVQWQVNTGSGFTNLSDGGVYGGSATTTLSIRGATAAMNGYQYDAVFTNSVGSLTTNSANLTVNVPIAVTSVVVNQDFIPVNGASMSGGVATLETDGNSGFTAGNQIVVGGFTGAQTGFNGTYTIATVSGDQITYEDSNTVNVTTTTFNANGYAISANATSDLLYAAASGTAGSPTGAQRSMVDSIAYTFSTAVNLAAGAVTLGIGTGTTTGETPAVATPNVILTPLNGGTIWVVTFASNSNATVTGHSIADGIYTATLNSSLVTAASGGSMMTTTQPTDTFYRLFGDFAANGHVNSTDSGTLNLSFGLNYQSASGYLAYFDYLGNGRVNSTDSGELNLNFGSFWRNINATI